MTALPALLLFLALTAGTPAAPGTPPDRAADTAALKDLACEAGRAYARRDLAALEKLTAEDYRQTDVRGATLPRAEWLEFVKNRKADIGVECDEVEVQYYADVAVVTGHWTYTRQENGQRVVSAQSRWTSVWTRYPEGWKRHVFQNTYINKNADRCATEPSK